MNKNLFIGTSIPSRADLVSLIDHSEKTEHGLILPDLGKNDTMSFPTGEKGSSTRVVKCLENKPQAQGTIIYLELIQTLIKVY